MPAPTAPDHEQLRTQWIEWARRAFETDGEEARRAATAALDAIDHGADQYLATAAARQSLGFLSGAAQDELREETTALYGLRAQVSAMEPTGHLTPQALAVMRRELDARWQVVLALWQGAWEPRGRGWEAVPNRSIQAPHRRPGGRPPVAPQPPRLAEDIAAAWRHGGDLIGGDLKTLGGALGALLGPGSAAGAEVAPLRTRLARAGRAAAVPTALLPLAFLLAHLPSLVVALAALLPFGLASTPWLARRLGLDPHRRRIVLAGRMATPAAFLVAEWALFQGASPDPAARALAALALATVSVRQAARDLGRRRSLAVGLAGCAGALVLAGTTWSRPAEMGLVALGVAVVPAYAAVTRRTPAWLLPVAALLTYAWYWFAIAYLELPVTLHGAEVFVIYSPIPVLLTLSGLTVRRWARVRWATPLYLVAAVAAGGVLAGGLRAGALAAMGPVLLLYGPVFYLVAAVERVSASERRRAAGLLGANAAMRGDGLLAAVCTLAILACAAGAWLVFLDRGAPPAAYPLVFVSLAWLLYLGRFAWERLDGAARLWVQGHRLAGTVIAISAAGYCVVVPDFWFPVTSLTMVALATFVLGAGVILLDSVVERFLGLSSWKPAWLVAADAQRMSGGDPDDHAAAVGAG